MEKPGFSNNYNPVDDFFSFQQRRIQPLLRAMLYFGIAIAAVNILLDIQSTSESRNLAIAARLAAIVAVALAIVPLYRKALSPYFPLICMPLGLVAFICFTVNYILLEDRISYIPTIMFYFAIPALIIAPLLSVPLLTVAFFFPILVNGLLLVYFGQIQYLAPTFLHSFFPLLFLYATALQVQRYSLQDYEAYARNQRLANTDALTGLLNRGAWEYHAHTEFNRCQREHRKLAIATIDIDHFKQVNDTYGHLLGDQAIRTIAECIRENVREYDFLGRLGGEEFILSIADLEQPRVLALCERLRLAIEDCPIIGKHDETLSLTASIGVAFLSRETTDLEDLMKQSDDALYAAKSDGRNRINIAGLAAGTADILLKSGQGIPES